MSSSEWTLFLVLLTLALALLCIGFVAARRRLRPTPLLPQSQRLKISDHEVHYVQVGQGPHLVLLHGWGASLFIWRDVVHLLANEFTITMIDLPGFGKSSKNPDLEYGLDEQAARIREVLEGLEIDQCHLVGSSMGGALALWLAKEEPKRILKVAVIGPATSSWLMPFDLNFLRWLAPWVRWGANRLTLSLILRRVNTKRYQLDSHLVESYLGPYIEDPNAFLTLLKGAKLIADPRLPIELKSMTQPTLIIWGEQDKLVPRRAIDELSEVLKAAEVSVLAHGGHHLMEDDPQWLADRLIRFISSSK